MAKVWAMQARKDGKGIGRISRDLGIKVWQQSLRLAWQSGRRQFGSDRGRRQRWKLVQLSGSYDSA
jgi:hypothetical protein